MKIRLVGADLFQADGRTDRMKLIVAFRSFADMPKTRVYLNIFEVKLDISAHSSIVNNNKNFMNYLNLNFKLIIDEKEVDEKESYYRLGRREMIVKFSGMED
jgi:hypothetical protein